MVTATSSADNVIERDPRFDLWGVSRRPKGLLKAAFGAFLPREQYAEPKSSSQIFGMERSMLVKVPLAKRKRTRDPLRYATRSAIALRAMGWASTSCDVTHPHKGDPSKALESEITVVHRPNPQYEGFRCGGNTIISGIAHPAPPTGRDRAASRTLLQRSLQRSPFTRHCSPFTCFSQHPPTDFCQSLRTEH
jgi:hypothetical protein